MAISRFKKGQIEMTKYKTIKEADIAYKSYVDNHICLVQEAFNRFFNEIFLCVKNRDNARYSYNEFSAQLYRNVMNHDRSKYSAAEFEPYRKYFYPSKEDTDSKEQMEKEFNLAWEHHYKNNPHHPEYWTIDIENRPHVNRMSNYAFAEMLCDWIAMSMNQKDSVYDWWFGRKGRDDKTNYLTESDISIIDGWLTANKDKFDFSKEK